MQSLPDAAALSEPGIYSPPGHAYSGAITTYEVDSAWGTRPNYTYSWSLYSSTEGTEFVESLLRDESSKKDSFAGIAEQSWDIGQHTFLRPLVNLECSSLDTGYLDQSSQEFTLQHNWTPTWPVGTGHHEQNVSGNLAMLQHYNQGRISPAWTEIGSEKETSMSSFTSANSPLAAAEPVSPTSLFPTCTLPAQDRQRHNSISHRGSRSTPLACTSESLKRRIDPLKHAKLFPRGRAETFACNLCQYTFRYKKDVDRHKASIHDKSPSWFCPELECKFATQGFSRKDKAFQHVRTHHRNPDGGFLPICAMEKLKPRSVDNESVSPRRYYDRFMLLQRNSPGSLSDRERHASTEGVYLDETSGEIQD